MKNSRGPRRFTPGRGVWLLLAALACAACAGPSAEMVDASRRGDPARVKDLLSKGASPDDRNGAVVVPPVYVSLGETPLCAAAANDRADVIKVLLEKGAAIDKRCFGWSIEPLFNPIWPATIWGKGYTPLLIAAWKGNAAALTALLDGKKPEAIQGLEQDTAHMLCDSPPCMTLVMDFFIPLFGKYDHVLETAEKRGHSDAVRVILDKSGAGAGSPILAGAVNPLVWAAQEGHLDLVQWLVAHGWDVNTTAQCDYGSPLSAAAGAGQAQIVDFLLKKGANPELSCDGKTPLQEAHRLNQSGTASLIQNFVARRMQDASEPLPDSQPSASAPEAASPAAAAAAAPAKQWWEK